jgi:hypothetical protein
VSGGGRAGVARWTRALARLAARVAPAVVACALALALAPARPARAQATNGSVIVLAPSGQAVRGDTVTTVTPTFLIQAVNFGPERPVRFRFQISRTPDFRVPLVFDTLFSSEFVSVTVSPPFALDGLLTIYWRATAIDLSGEARTSAVGGPLVVQRWATPVSPPERVFQPVRTRRPRFVWRSPAISDPPGPWEFTLRVFSLRDTIVTVPTRDTTVIPTRDLEPNLTYRWEVAATLPRTGQAAVVQSPFTFFIEVEDSTVATPTVLYQNFPNPFPTALQSSTCFWFDLERPAAVQLEVYDLRGLLVRRLLPNGDLAGELPAGRYGRGTEGTNQGCDDRTAWDGRDSRGIPVPAGVYLLRFRANGIEQRRRILFRGF